MSGDSNSNRPSVRFRDRFSHYKDRVKEKVKDKAIKHNITLFVHHNYTSNESDGHTTRHGFRQQMHHIKDVMKNKTHYESIKDKIKHKIDDKFDIHDNKTYPKGFYDSLFSPDTENDAYLQTGLVCLWVIAVLCIIPTLVIIFLPAKKKKAVTTSTNMIFFHVFLCEVFYLFYVLLAMINVSKDFRLGSFFCDIANYGMYVTIPIMQFTLLFLTLDRLSKQFDLPMTWAKIFTKPYLINVILCVTWVILIAFLVTFMLIKKQFSFNFIGDKISGLAPPIVGDVVHKLASRRHHCSIDGRLSSVFKTLIIVLFVILIVKPILISLGFHVLTPFCCKGREQQQKKYGERRTTKLVTIFLLLNLFFSFPFYFVSMFKSVFTRIDSTKDTFTLILKICFILRITNIIFECLAFYIFERNSWNFLRKLFYYGTCKKFPIFNTTTDDDKIYTKDPAVKRFIKHTESPSHDDENEEEEEEEEVEEEKPKKVIKRKTKKKAAPVEESEPDEEDEDGAFTKTPRKKSSIKRVETPPTSEEKEEEEQETIVKEKKQSRKKATDSEAKTKRKSKVEEEEVTNDDEPKPTKILKPKSQSKQQESGNDEDDAKAEQVTETTKRKARTKKPRNNEGEVQDRKTTRRKTPPRTDEEEVKERQTTRQKKPSHTEEEEEEEEKVVVKRSKSKSRQHDTDTQVANGRSTLHRSPSESHTRKTTRHSTPPSPTLDESEDDRASNASHTSAKMIKPSTSSKSVVKSTVKTHRTASPTAQTSRKKEKSSTASRSHHSSKKLTPSGTKKPHTHSKKPKKDYRTRMLDMSDDV